MSAPTRALVALAVLVACTSTTPRDPPETEVTERIAVEPGPTKPHAQPKLEPEAPTTVVPIEPPSLEPAPVEPIEPPSVEPVLGKPWAGTLPMHAAAKGGVFEVEVLVDSLNEADQRKLKKIAGREIAKRIDLAVEPGDASLPKLMRPTSLSLVTKDGLVTANVVDVLADFGPSGAHGILVTDAAAKKGAHAIALARAPKNTKARLHAVTKNAVDASNPVFVSALARAQAATGFTATESTSFASLAGLARTQKGTVYLLDVDLDDGGVHGLFVDTKDGAAVPLFDPSPEGRLRPLGAADLDGDGNDELLAQLDAMEGEYVLLFEWDAKAERYAAVTIAGDGT